MNLQVQCKILQSIYASVRDKLQLSRSQMVQKHQTKATPVSLKVGDTVFKLQPERKSKLAHKFSGPFLVTQKLHQNKYIIFDPSRNLSETVHPDNLKKTKVAIPTFAVPPPGPNSVQPAHTYNLRSTGPVP
ncbi:uncharacterized protein LOC143020554 [Oratosquilla oratoria]|uniref:uncharacterized protein LOC143020554 n=1 Tax=Oratosquilla oratoria TaxID=337810 RepID=UPI003F772293